MKSPLRRRIKADYTVLNRNVFNSFLKAGSVKLELLSSFVNEFQKVGTRNSEHSGAESDRPGTWDNEVPMRGRSEGSSAGNVRSCAEHLR